MKNIIAQNAARTFATSGIVKFGLTEGFWRIECQSGVVIQVPRSVVPFLNETDAPTIVLGIILTRLVDAGEVPPGAQRIEMPQ